MSDQNEPRWEVVCESPDLKAFLEEELNSELGHAAISAMTYDEMAKRLLEGDNA